MRFFDVATGAAPLIDLASRAVGALEGAATALGRIAHNAELVGTAMHVASQQVKDVCLRCESGGRLRCPVHGTAGEPHPLEHPTVLAHVRVGCEVTQDGSATAWCNTHNTQIDLLS